MPSTLPLTNTYDPLLILNYQSPACIISILPPINHPILAIYLPLVLESLELILS